MGTKKVLRELSADVQEGDAFKNISVNYIQADTASQEILKGLDVVNKDVVVLLADESHSAYDPDSGQR